MSNKTSIHREDIILYCFTLLMIAGAAYYLYESQRYQIHLLEQSYVHEVPEELKLSNSDSLELTFYKAQIQQTNKVAGHSSRGLISATTIRFIGFLVGLTMIFLGAIMIIRGIRENITEAEGSIAQHTNFKIASTSPGVLYSFFGMLVILSTIWKSGDVSFSVYPIPNYHTIVTDTTGNNKGSDVEEEFTDDDDDLLGGN